MANRLLLVDGDPRSLRVLDVHLRSAGFSVDTATTGSEAWARIESAPPELVIAAADIAGIDGFELCARLRQTSGGAQLPFVLVADQALQQKVRGLEVGADDYLAKPVYVKELVARVRALLQRKARDRLGSLGEAASGSFDSGGRDFFAGDLNDIAVVDLLQLCESSGRSGLVHLRGETNAVGSVYFRRGQIIDAEVGNLTGLDALSRLFAWTRGAFEVEWRSIRRNDVIQRPTADLVIEGMQRLDEWNRLSEGFAHPQAVFHVDYGLLAERLAEVPDEVNEILRLCDGLRTLRQVVEDSRMPDLEALTALIRLKAEGIICDIANGDAPERPVDVSVDVSKERSVHQDSLQDWPRGESSPVPSPIPTHSGSTETLTDVGGGVGPRRRRTAPGLGQAVSAPPPSESLALQDSGDGQGEVTPQALAEQADLVESPLFEDPRRQIPAPAAASFDISATPEALVTAASHAGATLASPLDPSTERLPVGRESIDGRGAQAGGQAPAAAESQSPGLVRDMAARPPGTMSRTHRGFGAPVSTDPAPDLATPVAAPRHGLEDHLRIAEAAGRLERETTERSQQGEPSDQSQRWPQPRPPVLMTAAPSLDEGGSAVATEATTSPRFPDEDISRREALDELGLPSRWRGLRILTAAALLGGAAALAVQRWHVVRGPAGVAPAGQAHPKVEPLADVSLGAPAATTPETQVSGSGPLAIALPEATAAAKTQPNEAEPRARPPAIASPEVAATVEAEAEKPAPRSGPPAIALPEVVAPEHPPGSSPGGVGGSGGGRIVGSARVVADGAKPGSARTRVTQPVEPPDAKSSTGRPRPDQAGVGSGRSGEASPSPESAPETPRLVPTGASASTRGPAPPSTAAPAFHRHLEDCRAAFTRSRWREALAACGAAVAANPRSAEALTLLAHTELNRGQLSRAAELAARALGVDPNVADAYVIIGGVRQDSGQNAEAKAAYRRYLQLAPHGRYAEDLRSIVNSL